MSYSSRNGKRPNEYASKSSHSNIIWDNSISKFLNDCSFPSRSTHIDFNDKSLISTVNYNVKNPIKIFIAIDGGYTEIAVKKDFPSCTLNFFQFGALIFERKDLENLSDKPFIDPEDIECLKKIERLKFVLPTKNLSYKEKSLIDSVRISLYEFFYMGDEDFIKTLKWFLFREYDVNGKIDSYNLSTCPNQKCNNKGVELKKQAMSKDYTFRCNECGEIIYLTDVFRLHEAIDDEFGAGGILAYVTNILEHIQLIQCIKTILIIKPALLKETIFIKDGPLAFFGFTANMHKPMRNLCNFLLEHHDLKLVGIEKSGAFVEHAEQIKDMMETGTSLFLNNDYIYKYIIPGKADQKNPYARTSYYGGKLIFKSCDGRLYVITVPVADEYVVLNPKKEDFKNIDLILQNIEYLRCDMYDNSLVPIALANKLISLSAVPSSQILEKFAKKYVK